MCTPHNLVEFFPWVANCEECIPYTGKNHGFTDPRYRRIRHLVKGRIPKTDAARELLKNLDTGQVRQILESIIKQSCKNKVLRQGTIDGYKVAALDGVELFTSYLKKCVGCLTRVHRNGKTEHFHRSVVCMTVGNSPHIILGEDMLSPRDGNEKDEGELTGGKRLIRDLHGKYGHFADVIVGDALYLNAPFIKTVEERILRKRI